MLRLLAGFIRTVFVLAATVLRKRPTHPLGVGARGEFRVADPLKIPANDFFVPTRAARATLRHANLEFADDARLDIRGAALRLEFDGGESLDLPMNTGAINTFQTAWVFFEFMQIKPWGTLGYRWFGWRHPRIWRASTAAMRRGASSYAALRYHSQLIFRFAATDKVRRVARYRLVGGASPSEEGLPNEEDLRHPFKQRRAPGDERPADYLRQEFRERVQHGGARYRFEMQFHTVDEADPPDLMDTSREWSEPEHPWHVIGELVLDELLDDNETEALRFNIANQPACLGVLPADGPSDFNSPGYLRSIVYPASQNARVGKPG